jgi:hypothetical protein
MFASLGTTSVTPPGGSMPVNASNLYGILPTRPTSRMRRCKSQMTAPTSVSMGSRLPGRPACRSPQRSRCSASALLVWDFPGADSRADGDPTSACETAAFRAAFSLAGVNALAASVSPPPRPRRLSCRITSTASALPGR